jgi:hypothetical protein
LDSQAMLPGGRQHGHFPEVWHIFILNYRQSWWP